jgi:hypothetical protein
MLRRSHSMILTAGLGHIIPLLLLLILLLPQRFMVEPWLCFFATFCGALLFIGTAGQKIGIIISSGYFREMKLRC